MACLRSGRFIHGRWQVSDVSPALIITATWVENEGREASTFKLKEENFGVLHVLRLPVGLMLLTPQASRHFGSLCLSAGHLFLCTMSTLKWVLPKISSSSNKDPVGISLFSLGKPSAFVGGEPNTHIKNDQRRKRNRKGDKTAHAGFNATSACSCPSLFDFLPPYFPNV